MDNFLVDGGEIVHIATFIAVNDKFFLSKSLNTLFCLLSPPRFNIVNCFQLVNTLQ